jgi:hypothetical protein
MNEDTVVYACENIGISGTTDVVVKRLGDKFEARCGIAIMGSTNMTDEKIKRINDPFSEEWMDNYGVGFGDTEQEAIAALRVYMKSLSDSIWAF